MKSVIHILGASGSGTSTLGRKVSETFGYKQIDTDDYYWLPTNPPYTTPRDVGSRIELMNREINDYDKVIITGSLCGWGDELIPMFNLVIRIVTPTEVRIERLKLREFNQFGERIMIGGDMFMDHQKFLQWAAEYDTGDINMRSKALHDEWLNKVSCNQLILDGTKPLDELIAEISKSI
jgi:adenylate kinase family enzyme